MGFSTLSGVRGRGLGRVQGYQIGGANVTTAKYGDAITYNIAGHAPGTIWLEQYVNGVLGYNGPFQIPMPPYTLSSKDQIGNWQSNAYAYQSGQKGGLLEQSTLYVMGSAQAQAQSIPGATGTLPSNFSCTGSDGSVYDAARITAIRTAFNDPNWMPAGCMLGPSLTPSGGAGGGGSSQIAVTISNAPSIPNALPSGSTVGASYNSGGQCLTALFRFILATGGGFATGSNRQGCSQTNSANCDPQFFQDLMSAIQYAIQNGEVPYKVDSSDEPWQLINCTISPDPAKFYRADGSLGGPAIPLSLIIGGALLLYFLGKRRGS